MASNKRWSSVCRPDGVFSQSIVQNRTAVYVACLALCGASVIVLSWERGVNLLAGCTATQRPKCRRRMNSSLLLVVQVCAKQKQAATHCILGILAGFGTLYILHRCCIASGHFRREKRQRKYNGARRIPKIVAAFFSNCSAPRHAP